MFDVVFIISHPALDIKRPRRGEEEVPAEVSKRGVMIGLLRELSPAGK
jgi:hypothetical protein